MDDALELADLILRGERVVGVELASPEVVDAVIEDCDLSGVVLTSPTVRRAQVRRTRLRDCVWSGGMLQDVTFDECVSERLSLRFCTLQRVTFVGCRLVGADFYGVTFDRVVFERCDLSGAQFDAATVRDLTMRSCDLPGVTGALSLKGATVDLDDLPALAPSLAREVGLRFSTDEQESG